MAYLPPTVLDILMQRVLEETSAAWLLIDSDGIVKDMGGGLSTFGLSDVEIGCIIQDQAIFLEGILAIQDPPPSIDSVEIDNGEYADIYLLEDQSDRWVVLLGRTETSRWKDVAQQKTNELRLLQKSSHINKLDFSSLLGVIALEKNSNNSFKLVDPILGCSGIIYPETKEQRDNLHPGEDFPFLAHFLETCQDIWGANDDRRLKSGPWVEVNEKGEEYVLEATALLWNRRKILLIERLNGSYKEHHAVLQHGRENVLIKRKLEQEIYRQNLMEKRLIEEKMHSEETSQAKSEFISGMSHELRTPLNSILGFSQLLITDYEDPLTDEQRQSVNFIITSGEHLLSIIGQLLDLSQIESGKMDMLIEEINPKSVIEACISIVGVLAEKQEVVINYECTQESVLRADFTRLKQIIINLLSNAIKYNQKGGSVVIETVLVNDDFRILVKDTGIGIPQKKQDKLFTKFSRLGQENSGIEGVGIGLAVTKNMVEAMGGSIGVESIEGKGSTFWVDLPLAVDLKC